MFRMSDLDIGQELGKVRYDPSCSHHGLNHLLMIISFRVSSFLHVASDCTCQGLLWARAQGAAQVYKAVARHQGAHQNVCLCLSVYVSSLLILLQLCVYLS